AAFSRYLAALRSPLAFASLLERDEGALPLLLAALSLGRDWADLLIADAEALDLLRQTDGQPLERETLLEDVHSEVLAFHDEQQIARVLARLRGRHQLRIAYGELRCGWTLERAMEQLSLLAEALAAAAFRAALRRGARSEPVAPPL